MNKNTVEIDGKVYTLQEKEVNPVDSYDLEGGVTYYSFEELDKWYSTRALAIEALKSKLDS